MSDDYVAPPIDLRRMQEALKGPFIELPQGLSKGEIGAFIDGTVAAMATWKPAELSDEDLFKIWQSVPSQGDPTGKKFAIAFARAVLAAR